MPRATKKAETVDFQSLKGLKHGRCGSHFTASGVEIPIGVSVNKDSTGRQYYVSAIGCVDGNFDTVSVYLHRYLDNGEVKRIVLNTPKPKWGR